MTFLFLDHPVYYETIFEDFVGLKNDDISLKYVNHVPSK